MRRRGFTIIEVVCSLGIMVMVVSGSVALLLNATQGFANTTAMTKLSTQNAQGLRYMGEQLRRAMKVTINTTGTEITYQLPKLNANADAITGERELVDPLVSDGVFRKFTYSNGGKIVTDSVTGRVIVRNVVHKDPQVGSSQYNNWYSPFQLTTFGSLKAVSLNLITQEKVGQQEKFVRLKTTVIIRNFQ